jgi:hypothetical protein
VAEAPPEGASASSASASALRVAVAAHAGRLDDAFVPMLLEDAWGRLCAEFPRGEPASAPGSVHADAAAILAPGGAAAAGGGGDGDGDAGTYAARHEDRALRAHVARCAPRLLLISHAPVRKCMRRKQSAKRNACARCFWHHLGIHALLMHRRMCVCFLF